MFSIHTSDMATFYPRENGTQQNEIIFSIHFYVIKRIFLIFLPLLAKYLY